MMTPPYGLASVETVTSAVTTASAAPASTVAASQSGPTIVRSWFPRTSIPGPPHRRHGAAAIETSGSRRFPFVPSTAVNESCTSVVPLGGVLVTVHVKVLLSLREPSDTDTVTVNVPGAVV